MSQLWVACVTHIVVVLLVIYLNKLIGVVIDRGQLDGVGHSETLFKLVGENWLSNSTNYVCVMRENSSL